MPPGSRPKPARSEAVNVHPSVVSPNSRMNRHDVAFAYKAGKTTMPDTLYPTDGLGQLTVGVDVSKKSLDLSSLGRRSEPRAIPNTPAACRRLAKRLTRLKPRVVAVEATGGYEQILVEALWEHDVPVAVLQPSRVRAHAKASGQLAKTDRIDARLIADFAMSKKIRLARKPSVEEQTLRLLTDRREQVVQDRVREIGRLEAVRDRTMRREIQRHIAHLEKLESSLDERIAQLIERVDSLRIKSTIMRRMLGVGPVVAHTLICRLPELGRVNRQSIAALAGLAPYANESGRWKGKRTIFGGRAEVRRVLYLAALTATRCQGPCRDRYLEMTARGKLKKVARIACARQMLVALNAQMAEHFASSESNPIPAIGS